MREQVHVAVESQGADTGRDPYLHYLRRRPPLQPRLEGDQINAGQLHVNGSLVSHEYSILSHNKDEKG